MIEVHDRPLITFALFAYNQEKYIREAVEGAFAQTYEPLEIILSDDCSSDRTFEIIEEMAERYRGPHFVRLNRNSSNLGIVPHINRIMELASGSLVLGAAGDDISLPERTVMTHAAWELLGRPYYLFFSIAPFSDEPIFGRGYHFREESMRAGGMIELPGASVLAPAAVWRREVFEVFGPLPATAKSEEKSIAFRAALLGEVVFISKPLVRYRIHDRNISVIKPSPRTRQNTLEARRRVLEWHLGRLHGFRQDLMVAHKKGLISDLEFANLCQKIERTNRLLSERLELYQGGLFGKVQTALRLAARASAERPDFMRKTKTFVERVLLDLFF